MKRIHFFFLPFFFFIISFKVWTQIKEEASINIGKKKSTKALNVSILKKEFIIDGLNNISHKVWLYLPPNYESSSERYPVIYMHDAQNLFDNTTSFVGEWGVDETLNDLYKNTGKGFIVIGIENGGEKRIEEYTPWKNEKYGGGKGAIYIKFIAKKLKPFIDQNYRTKHVANQTAIIGSSLGGLISFYGGLEYPDVFGKVGALSTSFWFSNKVIDFAKEKGKQTQTKLYLLIGEKEVATMIHDTLNMEKLLIELGFPKENIKSKVAVGGQHKESFWRAEFLETVKFLYNL